MIGKAWFHTQERQETGAWRFDTVVLDLQATGHAMSMLALPGTIAKAAPPGPLRTKAREIHKTLADPARASLCVVTTPEEMPVNEAAEICAQNAREVGIPLGWLFVNRVIEPMFAPGELAPRGAGGAVLTAVRCAEFRVRAAKSQAGHLARARDEVPLPVVILPEFFREEFGAAEVRELSRIVAEACDGRG